MFAPLLEWSEFLLRGAHVVVAMVWVGTSFYLLTWENKFNRSNGLDPGIAGNFWTIQGGDFYYVQKVRNAPERLPSPLHWFKYEAYFTWLSGFGLLGVFYYARADVMLLAPGFPLKTATGAVAVSLASLLACWGLYSLFSATRLARNLRAAAAAGVVFIALLSLFYSAVFPPRAAVLHIGAALGTIMSANVFFVIIPWHKRLVRAIELNLPLDEIYRTHPGYRSRHNHYLTLPVIALMLSAHAPALFASQLNWLVITLVATSAGMFKHFHTCIQRKTPPGRYLAAGLLLFTLAAWVSTSRPAVYAPCPQKIAFEEIRAIMQSRCIACHGPAAAHAAGPVWVGLDKEANLRALSSQIRARVTVEKSMPPANTTGMLDRERMLLQCWLDQ